MILAAVHDDDPDVPGVRVTGVAHQGRADERTTLCSTLGVLTWIFIDGHFSPWLSSRELPLTAPVIGLILAVIFGLSTDYEVFLVSRMVEARARARYDHRGGHPASASPPPVASSVRRNWCSSWSAGRCPHFPIW